MHEWVPGSKIREHRLRGSSSSSRDDNWVYRLLILVISSLFFILPLFAQEAPTAVVTPSKSKRIAFIDYERITQEAKVFQKTQEVFEAHRKTYEDEFLKYERVLSKEADRLMALRKKDPQQFITEHKEFERKRQRFFKKVLTRKKKLKEEYEKNFDNAITRLKTALKGVASTHHLKAIFGKKDMYYADEELDVTHLVIEAMNKG